MTTNGTSRSNTAPIRRDAATHVFKVGQTVRLKGASGIPTLPKTLYHITATLPPQGGSPQYRIRNDGDKYERVVTQDSLAEVSRPKSGSEATLIERTFGHGQRAETQQSRDQKAKEGKGSTQS